MKSHDDIWYPVARADDLAPRHVFHGQLNGIELALWRSDEGHVNAWENRCPHRSVRLTLGVNIGVHLRCQYHGWQYQSGGGQCAVIPASSQTAPPASLCARTFATVEAQGLIWVNLIAPASSSGTQITTKFTALPLGLRSIPFNAGLDDVAAELARYASYDDSYVAESAEVSRVDNELELSWQSRQGRRMLYCWLQPANAGKTIVHCSASLNGMEAAEGRRWHNRLLTTLRSRVETRAITHVKPVRLPEPLSTTLKTVIETQVAARWMAAQEIVAFKLIPAMGERFDFEAGAHLDVHTPSGFVRQYSLVNAPGERDHLIIGVKLEADSRGGSRSLHDALAVGDTLKVSLPKNHFPLTPGRGGVLIAGGIGITPILAMGAQLQQAGLPHELHYFTRGEEHVAFADRLNDLSGVRLYFGLAPEATRSAIVTALHSVQAGQHLYVCGPRPLVDLVRKVAAASGFPADQVHFELFANQVSHASDRPFRVRLDKSGDEFEVPSGMSLADALKARGVAVDTSCEQGVCGTCRVGVVEGAPEHRDVYLTHEEKQSRNCLMPCVSRSHSELLVLDL